MNRRTMLAVVGNGICLAIAGCLGIGESSRENLSSDVGSEPVASLQMSPVMDEEIARKVTYSIDVEHRTSERQLARTVIENGTKKVRSVNEPFPPETPFVYNDGVYELSVRVVESLSAVEFRITLDEVEDTGDEAIAYSDLPAVDKQVLKQYGWDNPDAFEAEGVPVLYLDEEVPESVLVPEPNQPVIVWESGIQARITVENRSETTVNVYKYSAHQVYESAGGYGEEIRRKHEFQLSNLSEEQERIVSEAISDEHGYKVPHGGSTSDAFDALTEWFSEEKEVTRVGDDQDSTVSGWYIVEYEGTVYWAELFRHDDSIDTTAS